MIIEWHEVKKYVDGFVLYKNAYEQLMTNLNTLRSIQTSGQGIRSQKSIDALRSFMLAAQLIKERVDTELKTNALEAEKEDG